MSSHHPSPTILITSLPPKTLVGLDLLSFNSTPNFHGVKDLPPGAHILYTGSTESFSLRTGEWIIITGPNLNQHNVPAIDIRLRQWDQTFEMLSLVDERLAMQQRANLSRIWTAGGLLPYGSNSRTQGQASGENSSTATSTEDMPVLDDWTKLTNYITPSVLERILGDAEEEENGSLPRWIVTSGSSAVGDSDQIPGISTDGDGRYSIAGGKIHGPQSHMGFLPVDLKKTWREGAVGRERTEGARDRSWALGHIAQWAEANSAINIYTTGSITEIEDGHAEVENFGEMHILGELQFTFLTALTLINFSCLEQWRRLLDLIFTCQAAITEREAFFAQVLKILRLQLEHNNDVEGGLLEMDGDDGGAILRKLLTKFRGAVYDLPAWPREPAVVTELKKLEAWAKEEYGWELARESIVQRGVVELEDGEQVEMEIKGAAEEDETGEYAPVVVELP
ncbi:hypothetical protein FQN57_007552 [Myotisia sp. PD_48]|nr:hypothetical protein FQN57_007552 [Myotisia sp. PD_48]